MAEHSQTYVLLQQQFERDLDPLMQRGFRILESQCADSPTDVAITIARERVRVQLSFDLRDRVGSLYVGRLSGHRPDWPNWDILNYLVRLCGFRGRLSYELSSQQRREMSVAEIMASDFGVLTRALFQFAPRIVDDTEDFEQPGPGT
jgi:hypothetical protein